MAKTARGVLCPVCKKGKTEHVALVPRVEGEKVITPDQYAVCGRCYREQFRTVYGQDFDAFIAERDARRAAAKE